MMINKYRSSARRLISWFNQSRNNWKEKALYKQKELRKAQVKIRDLEKSRKQWKQKAKENELKIKELKEENNLLQKDLVTEEKPKRHYYSVSKISISLQQVIISRNSLRGIQKNWA